MGSGAPAHSVTALTHAPALLFFEKGFPFSDGAERRGDRLIAALPLTDVNRENRYQTTQALVGRIFEPALQLNAFENSGVADSAAIARRSRRSLRRSSTTNSGSARSASSSARRSAAATRSRA